MDKRQTFAVIGTVILLVGAFMTLFGAVYSTTFTNVAVSLYSGYQAHTTIFHYYLCPIWSPPTTITGTDCAIQVSGPVPSPPSPPCILASIPCSANYTLNFIGIVLILLGVVVVGKGRATARVAFAVESREN